MTQAHKSAANFAEQARLRRLGEFFKSFRLKSGLSAEVVAQSLELETATYTGYEDGLLSMPLEDLFALTNLLNIAPEDVMDLVHGLYMHGDG